MWSYPRRRSYEDEVDDNDEEEVFSSEHKDVESSVCTLDHTEDEEDEEEGEGAEEEEEEGEETENGEEEGEEREDRRAEEEDMDFLSDEEEFPRPPQAPTQHLLQSQHQSPQHIHTDQANSSNRPLACLSCKETYTSRRAGTCRECYDEASETEEALKKEIEELQARIAFLKSWAPEAMEEDCADTVLECPDGSKIRAHRAVLISRSSVFKAMLESKMEESQTNTIKITDFTHEILRWFINYLYTADIYPESLEDSAIDLLALAEKYNVKQLKSVCERYMVSKLNSGNALSNFEYASLHDAKALKQAALSTIMENIHELVGNAEYQDLVNRDAKLVVEIFESYLESKKRKTSTL